MTDYDKKKRQAMARHDDALARLKQEERSHDTRRKYVLGQLILIMGKKDPKAGRNLLGVLLTLAGKIGQDIHPEEMSALIAGEETRSRVILAGALMLAYAEKVPEDRRTPRALRGYASEKARDLLADFFEEDELKTFRETGPTDAERIERKEQHRDASRVAAQRLHARRMGLAAPLPDFGDEDTPDSQEAPQDAPDGLASALGDIMWNDR
jgi:hypothetical protein